MNECTAAETSLEFLDIAAVVVFNVRLVVSVPPPKA